MHSVEVTYELTQKDFYDSFIAHRNRNALSKWSFRLLGGFAILCFGLGLLGVVIRHNSRSWADFGQWAVLAILWGGLVWVLPWWNARNQFLKQPRAKGARTMVLDDAGIRSQWNGGSAETGWANYIRWLECDTELLLHTSPACFNILSKRALLPEQLAEIRTRLAQNISRTHTKQSKSE
jgi:hypothetical protein